MNVSDFLDYLLGRTETRDLARELAYVYELRNERRPAVRVGAAAR